MTASSQLSKDEFGRQAVVLRRFARFVNRFAASHRHTLSLDRLPANGYKTATMSSIVRTAAAVVCTGVGILLAVVLVSAQNPTLQGHPEDYVRADIEYGARLYAQ